MFIGVTGIRKRAWLNIVGMNAMILGMLANTNLPIIAATKNAPHSQVPFIGCKSDGQIGPLDAPAGKNKIVSITPELAQKLAYYQAEQGGGVLAPRGWYCFGTYGSAGANLFVAPEPLDAKIFFSNTQVGFSGSAIQLSTIDGGTSGRFGVADIIARVFPAHKAFIRSVREEGFDLGPLVFHPYPHDKLVYKSKEIVEYQTAPNAEGLGTDSYLQKSGSPIRGVALLVGIPSEPSVWHLSTRLPPDLVDLSAVIIQQVERDAANADSK